jgi:hypothetical protein
MTLRQWIQREKISHKEVCKRLGVEPSRLRGWLYADKKPQASLIWEIEVMTRGEVRLADWVQ